MCKPSIRLGVVFTTCVACAAAARADEARSSPPRPRVTGLSHVALFVHDIEKSRAFYKDYLGFAEPYSVNDKDGTLHLTWIKISDRQTLELFPEKEAGSDRLNHIAFEVEDASAMRDYLAAKGVNVPAKVPTGKIGNFNFMVKDPDGHMVEITQYAPRGWTVREKGKFLPETRIAPRMSHAGIIVESLDDSIRFYCGVFGCVETWRGSRDGKTLSWVNLKVPDGDDYIELMLCEKGKAPPAGKRGKEHHICLEVPSVAGAMETLKMRTPPPGCKTPTEMKAGVNGKRQMNLYDPDGTRVELMEPRTADGKSVPPSTAPLPGPEH